jgi:N-acetylmuramoyl-L-alanine amidase
MEIRQIKNCKNRWGADNKPGNVKPLLFAVIHHTGGFSESSAISWFLDPTNKDASAHYLIGKDGLIYQFVPEDERAWHAGKSEYTVAGEKYTNLNCISLGYELCGDGNSKPYTEAQYFSLISLLSRDCNRWNISKDFIIGHEACAIPIGRKNDPGHKFEWRRVYEGVFNNPVPAGNNPANIIYSVGADVKE